MCETASRFSAAVSAVLAAVPRNGGREPCKFSFSNRRLTVGWLTLEVLYAAKRVNGASNTNQSTSKRRRTCPDSGIAISSPMPPTSDATHTMVEENRYYPSEQSQQLSASGVPPVQHLFVPRSPPHSMDYNTSCGERDGTNTHGRSGMAVDGTAHQSFRHADQVSLSQRNPMQCAHGSPLSQSPLCYDQYRAPSEDASVPQSGSFQAEAPGPRSKNGFTTGSISYFSSYPEASGAECTTSPINYFPTYSEADGVVVGAASGSHLTTECTTGSINYFPTYPEATNVLTGEALDINSDSRTATRVVDYFPTYVEVGGVFTSEAPDGAFWPRAARIVSYTRQSNLWWYTAVNTFHEHWWIVQLSLDSAGMGDRARLWKSEAKFYHISFLANQAICSPYTQH